MKKNGWTNIPQSVERSCRWTVASPFGGLHPAHMLPQKALLGSAHVQES
jgi:hypothetical protein